MRCSVWILPNLLCAPQRIEQLGEAVTQTEQNRESLMILLGKRRNKVSEKVRLSVRVQPWTRGRRVAHPNRLAVSHNFLEPKRVAEIACRAALRSWYDGPNAVTNAIGYVQHDSRSADAVIRVYDVAGNLIEKHEHKGDSKEPRAFRRITSHFAVKRNFHGTE